MISYRSKVWCLRDYYVKYKCVKHQNPASLWPDWIVAEFRETWVRLVFETFNCLWGSEINRLSKNVATDWVLIITLCEFLFIRTILFSGWKLYYYNFSRCNSDYWTHIWVHMGSYISQVYLGVCECNELECNLNSALRILMLSLNVQWIPTSKWEQSLPVNRINILCLK